MTALTCVGMLGVWGATGRVMTDFIVSRGHFVDA
jgi:hypothetical protein